MYMFVEDVFKHNYNKRTVSQINQITFYHPIVIQWQSVWKKKSLNI